MPDDVAADALSTATIEVVQRFHGALNRHDVAGMMATMTDDCIFENTAPSPDGQRYESQAAVCAFWEEFFQNAPQAFIAIEEIFGMGDRCVLRWRYQWNDDPSGHIRGVDIFTVRDGKVAQKLSYVKG